MKLLAWPDKVIYRFAELRDATFAGLMLIGAAIICAWAVVAVAFLALLSKR